MRVCSSAFKNSIAESEPQTSPTLTKATLGLGSFRTLNLKAIPKLISFNSKKSNGIRLRVIIASQGDEPLTMDKLRYFWCELHALFSFLGN